MEFRCNQVYEEVKKKIRDIYKENIFEKFDEELKWLISKIYRRKFFIRLCDCKINAASSVIHSEYLLRWCLFGAVGYDLIFDLIHEYGHILLGKPEKYCEKKYCWELAAWQAGWNDICDNFPEFKENEYSFNKRRYCCLYSYKEYICNVPCPKTNNYEI